MKADFNYIVGSGWWCADDKSVDGRNKFHGSDVIRGRDFHKLWYQSICDNTFPQKILIVDSASPVLPELNENDPRLEWISLTFNAGHSTNCTGKYCGWTKAVLLGLEYAMACEADYFVYVEQDVLLKGKGIVEFCIRQMKKPYMFGSGAGTPQVLQQSFFIIRKDGMRRFVDAMHAIQDTDKQLCPEDKFFIASSGMGKTLRRVYCFLKNRRKKAYLYKKVLKMIQTFFKRYDELPIGYGRSRPIRFEDDFFYFQHGKTEEIESFLVIHERAGRSVAQAAQR